MATREEIQKKYDGEKRAKILQLQTTLSSRTGQAAKQSALVKNGVSIINNVFTPEEFVSPDILGISGDGNRNFIFKSIREGVVKKNSSQEEPFGFIALESKCIVTDFNDKSVTVSYSIEEKSYLFLPSNSGTTGIRILTVPGTITQIKITDTERGFESLRKELSSFIYPTANIVINDKFEKHLDLINIILVDNNKLPALETLPVLSYSIFTLGDFNLIFPKPDGLEPSLPQSNITNLAGTSGIGGVTPTTPTIPTTTIGTGIPEVPTTTTVTPEVPTTTTVTPPTQTEQTGSARKYLSIEAIKDDDPVVPTETTSSRVLSLRYLDDAETSTDGYSSSSEINQIKTETAQSRSGQVPIPPTSEQNKDVLEKEAEELRKRTESQRKAEESDALAKADTKIKSATNPAGSNPGLSEGKSADSDKKNQPIPEDKKPKEKKQKSPTAKTFIGWATKEGYDPNGIIYRGTKPWDYSKPPTPRPPITYGIIEKRFKNLFNFGNNLDAIFKGYTIESPIDVGLTMNSGGVGRFNKNWPYMFGEGSEIHAAITRASNVDDESKGGFGTFGAGRDFNDANWAANPHWCGLCTNFMLFTNGKYKSDEESPDITSTLSVESYFLNSPFNPDSKEDEKKKRIKKIDGDIETKESEKKKINNSIKEKEKKKSKIEGRLNSRLDELLADTTVTGGDVNSPVISNDKTVKKERANLEGINAEIQSGKEKITSIDVQIDSLKKQKESIINSPSTEYVETNNVAKFSKGIHWNNSGLTPKGKELWSKIKMWPGGYIVRRQPGKTSGHVETLLHISPSGELYTIGGNTGLANSDGNGSEYGFKYYSNIFSFNGDGGFEWFFVVKRGTKSPYTNGIGVTVKQTAMYKKYVKDLDTDKELNPAAYNILRNIMEI